MVSTLDQNCEYARWLALKERGGQVYLHFFTLCLISNSQELQLGAKVVQENLRMADYRIYSISKDGRIVAPPEIVESPDDSEAIEKARQFVDGHTIEIWERARFLIKIDPEK